MRLIINMNDQKLGVVEVLLSHSSAAAFGRAFKHLAYLNSLETLWALDLKIMPKCEMYVGM